VRPNNPHAEPPVTISHACLSSNSASDLDLEPTSATRSSLQVKFDGILERVSTQRSLTGLVVALLAALRALGLAMLQHIIEERDRKRDKESRLVLCRACAAELTRTRNVRPTTRYTLLGRLGYGRRAYYCHACKRVEYPTDTELEVLPGLNGHSLEFANLVVLMTTLLPNLKAMNLFSKCFGFAVSTTLARGLTMAIGGGLVRDEMARAEVAWIERTRDPESIEPPPAKLRKLQRSKRMYVMVDDSKLGIQEGKRGRGAKRRRSPSGGAAGNLGKLLRDERAKAAKAAKKGKPGPNEPPQLPHPDDDEPGFRNVRALIVFRQEDLAGISKGRSEILRRRIVAHIGTLDEWRKLVHLTFVETGVYVAEEVVAIADGGAGIWELIDEMLPTTRDRRVIQVLDFYHASSYVWAAARAYQGHQTPAQRKACISWARPLLKDLREGRVANVIQRLAKLTTLTGRAAEEVERSRAYLDKHRERMRYKWLQGKACLIGSGAIESVHAWVIQARCRLPGMRWSVVGANAMLRLRCAWASGRWDEEFARIAHQLGPPDV
jgi:hypothetical protein